MIIDTDMGIDDVMGILYLLNRQDIVIKAILIDGNASVRCQAGLKNIAGILEMMGQSNIPIACGSRYAVHHYPDNIVQESEHLGGASHLLPAVNTVPTRSAVDLFVTTLKTSSEPVDILELGSLTTLAQGLHQAPWLKKRINRIYIMGGAVHVPGNIHDTDPTQNNKVSEWNIYIDPYAADKIFRSKIPITLIPLDATNQVPVDWGYYQDLKKNQHTKASRFVYEMLKHNETFIKNHEWFNWDSLAAVIATESSITTIQEEPLQISLDPGAESGATIVDPAHGDLIQVCQIVDRKKFQNLFLTTLNQ